LGEFIFQFSESQLLKNNSAVCSSSCNFLRKVQTVTSEVTDLTFPLYSGAAAGNRIVIERGAVVFNFSFLYGIKHCIISKACLHSVGQVSSDLTVSI